MCCELLCSGYRRCPAGPWVWELCPVLAHVQESHSGHVRAAVRCIHCKNAEPLREPFLWSFSPDGARTIVRPPNLIKEQRKSNDVRISEDHSFTSMGVSSPSHHETLPASRTLHRRACTGTTSKGDMEPSIHSSGRDLGSFRLAGSSKNVLASGCPLNILFATIWESKQHQTGSM